MASQPGTFNVQEFADAGLPLVSGRLYTYAYGTTTQKVAYTDAAGLVPHTYTSDGAGGLYIALNSRGELPAPLYLASGSYDLALKRSDGSSVWTRRADGGSSAADLTAQVALYAGTGGSSLIGFLQGGTGAVARTSQDKLREVQISVFDFLTPAQIADVQAGTALLDVSAGINNAITYAVSSHIREVYFPPGIYACASVLTQITSPVKLVGAGIYDPGTPVTQATATALKYTGTFTLTALVRFKQTWYGGAGMADMSLLCQDVCSGIQIDSCSGMYFHGVEVNRDGNIGLELTCTTTNTCSWNTFVNMLVDDYLGISALSCIRLNGGTGLGNACHNVFINTRIAHAGTRQGLIMACCDNNTFYQLYAYKNGGTGYGVYADSTVAAGFPGNNTFYHLQAMGGVLQDATSTFPLGVIYGYQQDNGEPLPVNNGAATADITYFTDNGRARGMRELSYRRRTDQSDIGNGVITIGNTFVTITIGTTEPAANYYVDVTPGQNPGSFWWVDNKTTTTFRVNLSVAAGGSWNFEYRIVRFTG